jgi:hypothetical protein
MLARSPRRYAVTVSVEGWGSVLPQRSRLTSRPPLLIALNACVTHLKRGLTGGGSRPDQTRQHNVITLVTETVEM